MATIIQSAMLKIASNLRRPSPSIFYYPGLSSPAPLIPARLFPKITSTLKGAHDDILKEFMAYKKNKDILNENTFEHDHEHRTLHNGRWDWKSYILKGERNADFATQCPKTAEVLESIPNLMTGTPFSFTFFSELAPGSTIDPHTGPCNLRIRVHYPLVVPPGDCRMQIGDEEVTWREGEPVFFDDTYLHRVWNNTDEERIVLLFDIWHPELYPEEIDTIKTMFAEASVKDFTQT